MFTTWSKIKYLATKELLSLILVTTNKNIYLQGGRHSSVVLSAPTILRPQVQIPSTPSMLFSICIIEIVLRK